MNNSDLSRFDPLSGGCYPGGKSGSGIYQRIINLMPPHQVYIEPFLGGGAVLRYKRPAQRNIGIDRDPEVIDCWLAAAPHFPQAADAAESRDPRRRLPRSPATSHKTASRDLAAEKRDTTRSRLASAAVPGDTRSRWQFLCTDGIEFLRNYPWTGRELVYCDPPYLHETRRDLKLYTYEMSTAQHRALLHVIRAIPVPVMISGYASPLYQTHLEWDHWHTLTYQAATRRGPVEETLWCNFPPPLLELHDYRYLGEDRRERERIKRMQQSWARRLAGLGRLERQALLSVLTSTAGELSGAGLDCAGAAAPSADTGNSSSLLNSQGLG